MSALQSLQRQGQEENAIMRQLAEKGIRDSASVRILTIITLIYLPCTVVSSFYSTQFVDRKKSSSGGSQMEYAQNSWLFFAVSVPLSLYNCNLVDLGKLCTLDHALSAEGEERGEELGNCLGG